MGDDERRIWPTVMPSDLEKLARYERSDRMAERQLATLERERDVWRENCERVQRHLQYAVAENADLERERALLLRYVRTAEYITPIFDDDDDAEVVTDFLAARRALIDAGLRGGDDTEATRQEAGE